MQPARPFASLRRAARRAGLTAILAVGFLMWGPGVAAAQAQPWTAAFWKRFGISVNVARIQPADGEVDAVVAVGAAGGFFPDHG